MDPKAHKAGFVNIIGLPNVGKSTLTNALLGWNLNIVNKKPQTTRHRIHAIINGADHQIILADTPGYIERPEYAMQEVMNKSALSVSEDADILLMAHDLTQSMEASLGLFKELYVLTDIPRILVLTKKDQVHDTQVLSALQAWSKESLADHMVPVSAVTSYNMDTLKDLIVRLLPEHPAYYSKEESSDRNVRFFVSEIIRNKILDQYQREIPYSVQVVVEEFKEPATPSEKTRIRAIIFVMRNSQRQIIIGRQGQAIKRLGITARADIEAFIDAPVYLDLTVKLMDNWRNDEDLLKRLGYQ